MKNINALKSVIFSVVFTLLLISIWRAIENNSKSVYLYGSFLIVAVVLDFFISKKIKK